MIIKKSMKSLIILKSVKIALINYKIRIDNLELTFFFITYTCLTLVACKSFGTRALARRGTHTSV